MKRHSKKENMSIYQEEITQSGSSLKNNGEKQFFPDLLTPYQRAILRGDKEFLKEEEKNSKKTSLKSNKALRDPIVLCYIAAILGSISMCSYSVLGTNKVSGFIKKAVVVMQENHTRE